MIIDEMIAFGEGKGGGQQMDESYAPETTADEASQVFSAEEAPAEASKKVSKTKSKAEEVADDIPF